MWKIYQVHTALRKLLHDNVSPEVAASTRIIYGGTSFKLSRKVIFLKRKPIFALTGGLQLFVEANYYIFKRVEFNAIRQDCQRSEFSMVYICEILFLYKDYCWILAVNCPS